MARCSKCGGNFGCSCSMINIGGALYCKKCAIEMYHANRNRIGNVSQQPPNPQNTQKVDVRIVERTLHTLKNLNNRK